MSRAALVPCVDPFISLLFLKNFKDIWQDEVDKLYICVDNWCGRIGNVMNYVERRFKEHPKVVWIHFNSYTLGHGEAIKKCLDVCEEDLVVLLENDSYIYEKGLLDIFFTAIETGACDAVGSPKGSACSYELYQASIRKFGNPKLSTGCHGPHFDPCFFFVKRSDLLKTDQYFGNRKFPKDKYIKEVDWTPQDDQYTDTFDWMSIQLRAMGLKFCYVPQCRVTHYLGRMRDMPHFGWVHIGGLAHGCHLSSMLNSSNLPTNILENEKNIAFWKIAVDLEDYDEIATYKRTYSSAIERFIIKCGANEYIIAKKIQYWKRKLCLN